MLSRRVARALAFGLLVSSVLMLPDGAVADVIYVFGQAQVVPAPASLRDPADPPIAFYERTADLRDPIAVNFNIPTRVGGDLGVVMHACEDLVEGDYIESDFVSQYPESLPTINEDVLVFEGPVLGISFIRSCMARSDAAFERMDVVYPDRGGLETSISSGDVLELFGSGYTVFHRLVAAGANDWDGYRVITEAPPPERQANVRLDCTLDGDGDTVAAGDMRRLTATLENGGDAEAPDAQIVGRLPPGAVATNFAGPFACEKHLEASIYICTHERSVLSPGETAVLTVDLRFDVPPIPVGRIVGFGSAFVNDDDLTNNDCIIPVYGQEADGGVRVPDGGRDGGRDAAVLDTGSDGSTGGPSTSGASFRGAGGCSCRAASAASDDRHDHDGLAGLIALGLLAFRRGRRVRS